MKLGFVECLDKQGIILVSFKRVFHGIMSINAYLLTCRVFKKVKVISSYEIGGTKKVQ